MSELRLPSIEDFADAEHCVLEDVTVPQPSLTNALERGREVAGELRRERRIEDRIRGQRTTLKLYTEGWAEIEVERRGRETRCQRIDLRYLDPVPSLTRFRPKPLIRAAGILAGITGAAAVPALIGWLPVYTITTAVTGLIACLATLYVAYCRSHEKIVFRTLHGRARALQLTAGLGTIRRFHKLLPEIVNAIAGAAESIHEETAVYLRAEMREHYRLRNEGILSTEECVACTDRILGKFDAPQ
jgi:hypothetical protein